MASHPPGASPASVRWALGLSEASLVFDHAVGRPRGSAAPARAATRLRLVVSRPFAWGLWLVCAVPRRGGAEGDREVEEAMEAALGLLRGAGCGGLALLTATGESDPARPVLEACLSWLARHLAAAPVTAIPEPLPPYLRLGHEGFLELRALVAAVQVLRSDPTPHSPRL